VSEQGHGRKGTGTSYGHVLRVVRSDHNVWVDGNLKVDVGRQTDTPIVCLTEVSEADEGPTVGAYAAGGACLPGESGCPESCGGQGR
jgi:hypothetical protein